MIITSSDIGTSPDRVEANLTRIFKTAVSWDAVLLIDEADVFMERRSITDLTRNSLVAGNLKSPYIYSPTACNVDKSQASSALSSITMESCSSPQIAWEPSTTPSSLASTSSSSIPSSPTNNGSLCGRLSWTSSHASAATIFVST